MRALLAKVNEDAITYWLHITLAAIFVWRSTFLDDEGRLYLLFAATFLLIHAHGNRILAAVNRRNEE